MNQFVNNTTKEIVRITSEENNFYVLNNGTSIDKTLFYQRYAILSEIFPNAINANEFLNQPTNIQPTKNTPNHQNNEQILSTNSASIDPIDFLNTPSLKTIDGLDNIKNINTDRYVDMDENQRVQIKDLSKPDNTQQTQQYSQNDRQRMIDEYNRNSTIIQAGEYVDENDDKAIDKMMNKMQQPKKVKKLNENGLTVAEEMIRNQQMELTGEDPYKAKIEKFRASRGLNIQPVLNPKIIDDTQNNGSMMANDNIQEQYNQQIMQPEDPTTTLFKKFRKNHNITINLKIKDQISKPDFIKVMADGLDGDIIQYYTDEIFKSYFNDVVSIKKSIYDQIFKDVYNCLPEEFENHENDDVVDLPPKKQPKSIIKEEVIILIPGKKTKNGERTYKYIDEKGKIIETLEKIAAEKGYKVATKKDIK